jgi:hypothetical protein
MTWMREGASGSPSITYPAECVNPPASMTSEEWLKKGMPGAKC